MTQYFLVKTSIAYNKWCIIKVMLMVDWLESDVPPICLAIRILLPRSLLFYFFFKNKDRKYYWIKTLSRVTKGEMSSGTSSNQNWITKCLKWEKEIKLKSLAANRESSIPRQTASFGVNKISCPFIQHVGGTIYVSGRSLSEIFIMAS